MKWIYRLTAYAVTVLTVLTFIRLSIVQAFNPAPETVHTSALDAVSPDALQQSTQAHSGQMQSSEDVSTLERISEQQVQSPFRFVTPGLENNHTYFLTDLCNSTVQTTDVFTDYQTGILRVSRPNQRYPKNFFCDVCIHSEDDQAIRFWFGLIDLHIIDSRRCWPQRVTFYILGETRKDHLCSNVSKHFLTYSTGQTLCVEFTSYDYVDDGTHVEPHDGVHEGFVMYFQPTTVSRKALKLRRDLLLLGVLLMVWCAMVGAYYIPYRRLFISATGWLARRRVANSRNRRHRARASTQTPARTVPNLPFLVPVDTVLAGRAAEYIPSIRTTGVTGSSIPSIRTTSVTDSSVSSTDDQPSPPPYQSRIQAAGPPEYTESRASSYNPPGYEMDEDAGTLV